ncbi:Os06g0335300 [Oryza sativa Japonica Group]|nr:Os06g0335300 [Oryza sativa Japonica Group]
MVADGCQWQLVEAGKVTGGGEETGGGCGHGVDDLKWATATARGGTDGHGRLAGEAWQKTAFGRRGSDGRSDRRPARRVEARPVAAEAGTARGGAAGGGGRLGSMRHGRR